MRNLLYIEVRDHVIDALDNRVLAGIMPETLRTKLTAPEKLAFAINQAVKDYVRLADSVAIPSLVETVTLTAERTFSGVRSYPLPEQAYTERSDGGFICLIVGGEELAAENAVSLEQVMTYAGSSMHSAMRAFAYDDSKRRFYVPKRFSSVQGIIVKRPEEVDITADEQDLDEVELPVKFTYLGTIVDLARWYLLAAVDSEPPAQPEAQEGP